MSLLIKYGLETKNPIQIRSETMEETTCLIYAVKRGWNDIIESLLDKHSKDASFKIDLTDGNGKSAFYYAMKFGRFDIASLLFEKGAQVTPEILDLGFDKHQCEIDNNERPWINQKTGASHDFVPKRLSRRASNRRSTTVNNIES